MKIIKVEENNKDLGKLCLLLEKFQHQILPELAEKGYTLADTSGIDAFLLYDGKDAIGSIGLKHIDNNTCEIVRVFMKDEYRGNGFAQLLFNHIEEYARNFGYRRAELITWANSISALALYKKLGYIRSEEKKSEMFNGLKYVELHKELK